MGCPPQTKRHQSVMDQVEDELVPQKYRVRAPDLVWSSKNVTWHGQDLNNLCSILMDSIKYGDSDKANSITIELLVSGYSSRIWNVIWHSIMLHGLGMRAPDLWSMFLTEYKTLNAIRNRLNRLGRPWDIANHQEYRNHLAHCVTILCVMCADESEATHVLPLGSLSPQNSETYITSCLPASSRARGVAQEYILLTKTGRSSTIGLQELHFNLTRFLHSVNTLQDLMKVSDVSKASEALEAATSETFFWIYEIVRMSGAELHLRGDFQYYMPKLDPVKVPWVTSAANILWNYLFIRCSNKQWKYFTILSEVYTMAYKHKDVITCAAILYNLLLMQTLYSQQAPAHLCLYDSPVVIQAVMRINKAYVHACA